jgi:type IV secretion system protein VirB10
MAAPGGAREEGGEGGGRREGFLARQRGGAEVLDSVYAPPRSAFELQAGAVIPAALVTGLNSDLPGRVIAQVTAPVFDSVTGDHLLIPQGARLLGTYDSASVYGDTRLFLVWNRILMPNGWSLRLAGMEATDPMGAAGLSDRTDGHLDRLAGAIGLSALLSVVANEAEGEDERAFTRSVGDAAAQEAARVGGRIVDRQLTVRPTLRVRPGAPVRVLVTRDMQLRPYGE